MHLLAEARDEVEEYLHVFLVAGKDEGHLFLQPIHLMYHVLDDLAPFFRRKRLRPIDEQHPLFGPVGAEIADSLIDGLDATLQERICCTMVWVGLGFGVDL